MCHQLWFPKTVVLARVDGGEGLRNRVYQPKRCQFFALCVLSHKRTFTGSFTCLGLVEASNVIVVISGKRKEKLCRKCMCHLGSAVLEKPSNRSVQINEKFAAKCARSPGFCPFKSCDCMHAEVWNSLEEKVCYGSGSPWERRGQWGFEVMRVCVIQCAFLPSVQCTGAEQSMAYMANHACVPYLWENVSPSWGTGEGEVKGHVLAK